MRYTANTKFCIFDLDNIQSNGPTSKRAWLDILDVTTALRDAEVYEGATLQNWEFTNTEKRMWFSRGFATVATNENADDQILDIIRNALIKGFDEIILVTGDGALIEQAFHLTMQANAKLKVWARSTGLSINAHVFSSAPVIIIDAHLMDFRLLGESGSYCPPKPYHKQSRVRAPQWGLH